MNKIAELASEMLETFAISLALFLAVYVFVAFPEVVVGASMEPTLHTGERLLVERLTPRLNKLKRGDIIIFNAPGTNSVDYVKRIVGLPNDTLEFVDCTVYLVSQSGEMTKLKEPYLSDGVCTKGPTEPIHIPSGYYFVMGDNRAHSADSRTFGYIEKSRINGKVFLRFWPFWEFRIL